MNNQNREQPEQGLQSSESSPLRPMTYEHPPLTRDQEEYLRRIQSSTSEHDRNLLMGGPCHKQAS